MPSPAEKSFEILAATALVGLIWSANTAYRDAGPSLRELRNAPPNDPRMLQDLIDADITVGIPTLVAGIVAAYIMRSWLPLGITIIAAGAIGWYHHSILSDPSTRKATT